VWPFNKHRVVDRGRHGRDESRRQCSLLNTNLRGCLSALNTGIKVAQCATRPTRWLEGALTIIAALNPAHV
jgi:hypothetical protein